MSAMHRMSSSKLLGGVMVRDHTFAFPLDWKNAGGSEKVEVFVRELRLVKGKTTEELEKEPVLGSAPAVMYLQGGPGFPSPRPTAPPSGWMKSALDKGLRVLLLDQRGTGNSTAMNSQRLDMLAQVGGQALQLEYLKHMRSDAIAADVNAIRTALCGSSVKISLLGQSFGGFCILSSLSFYQDSIERCLFTCGLAPVAQSIREVYTATYRRMLTRNKRFYGRYPQDIAKVKEIAAYIQSQSSGYVTLPSGGHLTLRRFQQLGLMLGSASGMESMHWLLDSAFFDQSTLSEIFLQGVEDEQRVFETNPIYWLMHESIYINGRGDVSGWAAESVLADPEFKNAFDATLTLGDGIGSSYINFTGEMVYSWMAEDYSRLRPYRELANALAELQWDRPLYDVSVLHNLADKVPCAALVSYDDVYVEREFSENTASILGSSDTCRLWVSNEFQHSGLRDDPARVFKTLYDMTEGALSLPS